MKKSNEFGRTMIEVIAVLGIIGTLMASIASMVMGMFAHYKNSILPGQVRDLRKNISNRYSALGLYNGLNAEILIKERLAPYGMIHDKKLLNAFGGEVTVAPSNYNCTNCSYTITFKMLPRKACVEVATLNWQVDNTSTLISININSTAEGDKFVWPINKIGSGGIVAGSTTKALPVSNKDAFEKCNTDNNNFIIWEFQ